MNIKNILNELTVKRREIHSLEKSINDRLPFYVSDYLFIDYHEGDGYSLIDYKADTWDCNEDVLHRLLNLKETEDKNEIIFDILKTYSYTY